MTLRQWHPSLVFESAALSSFLNLHGARVSILEDVSVSPSRKPDYRSVIIGHTTVDMLLKRMISSKYIVESSVIVQSL